MQRIYNVQVQRVDNGFVIISQNDEQGVKNVKRVATSEDDTKVIAKEFIDHMFDSPPLKEEKKQNEPNG